MKINYLYKMRNIYLSPFFLINLFNFILNSKLNKTEISNKCNSSTLNEDHPIQIFSKRNADSLFDLDMPEEISDMITLAKVIYSIYSGDIDYAGILKLASKVVNLGLFESLPSTYNFREKYNIGLSFWLWQRRCEPSAGYAAAISTSYRRKNQ